MMPGDSWADNKYHLNTDVTLGMRPSAELPAVVGLVAKQYRPTRQA
ncbi:hypothetical protein ACVWZK_003062 [Bradyrhizobium sp. GM0.4]